MATKVSLQWNSFYVIDHLIFLYFIYRYTSEDAIGDAVAGITVGLTVIPQALAYAGIAGLPAAVSLFFRFF